MPIAFINDTKLNGYTPRVETIQDYMPIGSKKIPTIEHLIKEKVNYPRTTKWHLDQSYKRRLNQVSNKMEEDMANDYRKNRNQTYTHHLIQQINNNTKARVESDMTIRA